MFYCYSDDLDVGLRRMDYCDNLDISHRNHNSFVMCVLLSSHRSTTMYNDHSAPIPEYDDEALCGHFHSNLGRWNQALCSRVSLLGKGGVFTLCSTVDEDYIIIAACHQSCGCSLVNQHYHYRRGYCYRRMPTTCWSCLKVL